MDLMNKEKRKAHGRYIFPMGSYVIRGFSSMERDMGYMRNIGTMDNYGIR